MAIKTISKLDPYWNEVDEGCIGGSFHLYESNNSNDEIPETKDPQGKSQQVPFRFDDSTDYNLLFEVSKPAIKTGAEGFTDEEFQSYKLTYKDLIKNIILDTKTYLNARNNLGDFDLCCLVNKDYTFAGNKTFKDDVIFNNNVTFKSDVDADGITITLGDKGFLNGYAYGLKDNKSIKTTIPNQPNAVISKVGDPVWFYQGRPASLSCVNYATYAYNMVDESGKKLTVGDNKHPVYFVDGVPISTNIIVSADYADNAIHANRADYATNAGHANYATHAYWSDLGEKYLADASYEPGTLIQFGGDKELTIAKDEVNAIVSTKAFELNAGLKDGTVIALCGRVPTKVIGKIKKFDKIVLSSTPGVARKRKWYDFFKRTIGRALETNQCEEVKLVECVTQFNI